MQKGCHCSEVTPLAQCKIHFQGSISSMDIPVNKLAASLCPLPSFCCPLSLAMNSNALICHQWLADSVSSLCIWRLLWCHVCPCAAPASSSEFSFALVRTGRMAAQCKQAMRQISAPIDLSPESKALLIPSTKRETASCGVQFLLKPNWLLLSTSYILWTHHRLQILFDVEAHAWFHDCGIPTAGMFFP